MVDKIRATQLPQTSSYGPTDYFLIIRGGANGPLSGPLLLPADTIVAASDGVGSGGSGGAITRVFGRIGDITAEFGDYTAALTSYDNASSGLNAANVQTAIDAVAALTGNLPAATSEGHFLGLNGSLLPEWMEQSVVSVFGRDGVVELQAGDVTADLVTDANGFVIMTDAERTKLATLNGARQMPAGGTTGQVATKASGDDYDIVWATPEAGGGGGGSLSQIDLLDGATPKASAPPTFKWVADTGVWSFSQSGADELRRKFRWPGGAATVKIQFVSEGPTTGNGAWTVAVMALTPGDAAAIATDSFDTANTSNTVAVPGTAGHMAEASITVSNTDGIAAGDYFRVSIKRHTGVASNAAGALALHTATMLFA